MSRSRKRGSSPMPGGPPLHRVQSAASTMHYNIHDPFAVDHDDTPPTPPSRGYMVQDDFRSGPVAAPAPRYTTYDTFGSGPDDPSPMDYGYTPRRDYYTPGPVKMSPSHEYTMRDPYRAQYSPPPVPISPAPVRAPPKKIIHNIIIFGESGSGKTSMINMLAGREVGAVSSGARGCTFKSTSHQIELSNVSFRIFDTSGLEEGEAGRVPKAEAIMQLHNLIMSLTDGVSLIIFCMRAPRIKDSAPKNWRLFHEVICQKKVPICIAITGLEQEVVMDDWWRKPENKATFQKYEMIPAGFACITATKGKQRPSGTYQLQEEYDESKVKMEKLILNHYMMKPWSATPVEWVKDIIETTYGTEWCFKKVEHKETIKKDGKGLRDLIERCNYSEADARDLAAKLGNFM